MIIGVSANPKHDALGLASVDYYSDDGDLSFMIFGRFTFIIGSGSSG